MLIQLQQVKSVIYLIEWFEQKLRRNSVDPDDAQAETYPIEDRHPSLQLGHRIQIGDHSILYEAGLPTKLEDWGESVPEFSITFEFLHADNEDCEVTLVYYAQENKWRIDYDIQYQDHNQPPPAHIALVIDLLNSLEGFDPISTAPTTELNEGQKIDNNDLAMRHIIAILNFVFIRHRD